MLVVLYKGGVDEQRFVKVAMVECWLLEQMYASRFVDVTKDVQFGSERVVLGCRRSQTSCKFFAANRGSIVDGIESAQLVRRSMCNKHIHMFGNVFVDVSGLDTAFVVPCPIVELWRPGAAPDGPLVMARLCTLNSELVRLVV